MKLSDAQKKERIKFLYHQLDVCGQLIADDDEWGVERKRLNREYKNILKELAMLEPENWNYPAFQKPSQKYDGLVADFCKENKCPKCNGELRQTKSGSLRVICNQCGIKYQLHRK